MTITLDLPASVECTIEEQARQRDMAVADYLLDVVLRATREEKPPLREKNRLAIELLKSWDDVTPEEIADQKETWAILEKAAREDKIRLREVLLDEEIS